MKFAPGVALSAVVLFLFVSMLGGAVLMLAAGVLAVIERTGRGGHA